MDQLELKKTSLPYERFLEFGPASLTDAELLAIIIRTGTQGITPVEIGSKLLEMGEKYAEGLAGLHHLSLDEIMSVPGIGEVKAVKLKCIAELSNRISKSTMGIRKVFHNTADIANYFMEEMRHHETEHVKIVYFNNQMMLTGDEEMATGTVNAASISPREIFIGAMKNRAVRIAMLHNHPSGDPSPSIQDIDLTDRVNQAGRFLDIKLIDHIIIGDRRYYSFAENKLLDI